MILLLACASASPIRIVGDGFPGVNLYNQTEEDLVELTWSSDEVLAASDSLSIEPYAVVRLGIPDGAELLEVRSADNVWEFTEFSAVAVTNE